MVRTESSRGAELLEFYFFSKTINRQTDRQTDRKKPSCRPYKTMRLDAAVRSEDDADAEEAAVAVRR